MRTKYCARMARRLAAGIIAGAAGLALAACSESPPPTPGPGSAPAAVVNVPHGLDPTLVARGADIYTANCAACHGARAEGAPNWQRPGPDGKYPAPPLDGSGHAWHHPSAALKQTIRGGTLKLGGSMPAWKDKLTDDDIEVVIVWMQSRWPEEIYRSWLAMEEKARQGHAAH